MSSTVPSALPLDLLPEPSKTRATKATYYVSCHVIIEAPVTKTFQILADLSQYPEWNTFVPKAEVNKPPPAKGQSDAILDSDRNSEIKSLTSLRRGDEVVLHVRMKPTNTDLRRTPLKIRELVNFPPSASSGEISSAETSKLAKELGIEPLEQDGKTLRLVWGSEMFGLRTERVMEVRQLPSSAEGKERCEFRSWEGMTGVLAHTVKSLYGSVLQERFLDWARDLKQRAEGLE